YMLKVQKTKNGIPYVAGIGAGIEDADGQTLSNILLQADRIAMITRRTATPRRCLWRRGTSCS
nr:DUF1983 domain-containing protein [Escherichia coli]